MIENFLKRKSMSVYLKKKKRMGISDCIGSIKEMKLMLPTMMINLFDYFRSSFFDSIFFPLIRFYYFFSTFQFCIIIGFLMIFVIS